MFLNGGVAKIVIYSSIWLSAYVFLTYKRYSPNQTFFDFKNIFKGNVLNAVFELNLPFIQTS